MCVCLCLGFGFLAFFINCHPRPSLQFFFFFLTPLPFAHLSLSQALEEKASAEAGEKDKKEKAVYVRKLADWFIKFVTRTVPTNGIVFSDNRRSFISQIGAEFRAEDFVDYSELISLCSLIGPYGIRYRTINIYSYLLCLFLSFYLFISFGLFCFPIANCIIHRFFFFFFYVLFSAGPTTTTCFSPWAISCATSRKFCSTTPPS